MSMNPHFLTLICLLTLCAGSNAQQTFEPKEKEPVWTYNTIAELHQLAKQYLKTLDERIADKKAAAEYWFNPFKRRAKIRHDELVKEREYFLHKKWECPHTVWKDCGNCGGDGKVYVLGTCSVCKGKKGLYIHVEHPAVDAHHYCGDTKIRDLLGIKDTD